jgi:hypothetical protein
MKQYLLIILLLPFTWHLYSQNFSVKGVVVDAKANAPLQGANIILISLTDTSYKKGTTTGKEGKFEFTNVPGGAYTTRVTFIGYKTLEQIITVAVPEKDIGILKMTESVKQLKDVEVQGKQIGVQQVGDTTQYKANSYKVNPDANAEQLVTKMPGITVESGNVKSSGENIKQVLVNDKPFFGDDPNMALKNLPAEVIDKIQIFDKMSDQAQLTGFDDGNSVRTMNIVTRQGMNTSQFGKIYGGYGTNNRYLAGGNVNFFKDERRISVIGLFNNVNQQNFSTQDLFGVMGGSTQRRGGFGGGRPEGYRGHSDRRSGSGSPGGGDFGNMLIGQQNGIVTTNAVGINYSDKWGKNISVSGSYFFNMTDNENTSLANRNYYSTGDSGLVYYESSRQKGKNYNHRLNFRFEYTIDTLNSLILTPRISFQNYRQSEITGGQNLTYAGDSLSSTDNNASISVHGYNLNNNILFRHKFQKKGRTITAGLGTSMNSKDGGGKLFSLDNYFGLADTSLIDQKSFSKSDGRTFSGNISYTEPVGKNGQLQISYNPSQTRNKADKETYNFNQSQQVYDSLDQTLSNKYINTYNSQNGGITYKFNGTDYNISAGLSYQYASLSGTQVYPYSYHTEKEFYSLLPSLSYNYKNLTGRNIRITIRASTNAPSASQLQNVVDNSSPLSLSAGNPELKQEYSRTFMTRYGNTNSEKGTSFFAFIYANSTSNYIGNSTFIAFTDSVQIDSFVLNRGSQFTRPVNLDGYWNLRTFLTYGIPLSKIKCNLNLNAGCSYSVTPGLINGQTNHSVNDNVNLGVVLASNISEKVDFTASWFGYYTKVSDDLREELNSNYFYHNASIRFNWIIISGLFISTDLAHTYYTGLGSGTDTRFLLWNMSVGKKFLKDQNAELKVTAFDLLKQNNSFSRSVTDTYIEDTQTEVLKQYFMLTFTYNLKKYH